ncbi:hypothetical protein SAMN04487906_1362 [Zhouia amylolytica]|uniref:Glycosyl hydrolases family 43 n=1 Tax=Zhouia amylolytica TaxID=376730 RepID=A0A1I6RV24_9FLAO|nr:glycoside hydrolase family protein [Zhouia amylolytica]MCQ0111850.1 glycoside hydrolase family protein [Zhouia amylolytica]SFS68450.1 hypothetical protein SAMN04487906_1362 [Zhouia amylolytica]
MKKSIVGFNLILLLFFSSLMFAQNLTDDLSFSDRLAPITEQNFFKSSDYYNWGVSIIKDDDGLYHNFYARWPKKFGFYSWLTHSEVAHATSPNPWGPWTYKETVLKSNGPGHWDAVTVHNPKIKYFEGTYYLYYISTNFGDKSYTEDELIETAKTGYRHPNWSVLRNNQRTGLAVAKSIDGPWKRSSSVLIEPSGPITTLTVNPAIAQGSDGLYYMVVKGDKPNEKRFVRNQAVAVSENPAGPFEIQDKPVIDYLDTEDVSIWFDKLRNRFYGIFHAPEGFIGLITSEDGKNWNKAKNYRLMPKELKMKDGTVFKADRLERPFVYTDNDGQPVVLCLAAKKGDDAYSVFIPIDKE